MRRRRFTDGRALGRSPLAAAAGAARKPGCAGGGVLHVVAGLYRVGATQRGHSTPLVKRWNGASWQVQPSPDRARASIPGLGHDRVLNGVACTSARTCLAVGQYGYASDHQLGWAFAERWNGSRWSLTRVPRPAGALFSALYDISCRSPRACTAVGEYTIAAAGARPITLALIERYDGFRWSVQASPRPVGAASSLGSVSCASASACTAVGSVSSGAPANEQFLLETWDGIAWSAAVCLGSRPGRPEQADVGVLSGTASVRVIGGYRNGSRLGPLTVHWDGGPWNAQLSPRRPA